MNNNIKQLLILEDVSILALSNEIGLTYASTHQLVNRKSLDTTPLETLLKVAKVLNVEIEELYKEEK